MTVPAAEVAALLSCIACGRGARNLKKQRCEACYMRLYRGVGGAAKAAPELDPEIAELLLPVPGASATFAARVFSYVDASGDCWEWTGKLPKDGYGVIGKGTPAENKRRGYGNGILYAKRKVCDNGGHPLDGVLGGRGGKARNRYCKTCARERERMKRLAA